MGERKRPIGILGGTFDPIHYGHLRPALELLERLALHEIRFIPSRQPPHRTAPGAAPAQRLAMLERAIADQKGFILDDREMRRQGPSYMVDTLASLRAQFGEERSLCLLLGQDAFAGLESWHRWRDIIELAHIVVAARPGYELSLDGELAALTAARRLEDADRLGAQPAGGILFQPVTPLDISATAIRALLAQKRSPRYLLPEAVRTYLSEQGLYQIS